MDASFLEAVDNGEHVIFGRALHDFCLYDILLLEIAENPLWIGGSMDFGDLIGAVLICSAKPGFFLRRGRMARALELEETREWIQAWAEPELFAEGLQQFAAYVADFNTRPETCPSKDGETLKSPWIISMASFIEARSNMSYHEIMSAPVGLMHHKYAALAEIFGGIDLVSEEEKEAITLIESVKQYE